MSKTWAAIQGTGTDTINHAHYFKGEQIIMNKLTIASLAILISLAFSGSAFAQDSIGGMHEKHEGMTMENCIGHIAGAVYKTQNTKDGVVLTIAGEDPATVKKIQDAAQKLTATNETVVCPVEGTKIKQSKAYDSTVYKGKTYYFCCAACKPEFLKNPDKYAK
jgi:YHS domain-containing protein